MDPLEPIKRAFKQVEEKFGGLERRIVALERKAYSNELIDANIKIQSAIYEKAAAYTNLVIVAGYAGFFALWSLTKPYLSPRDALVVAILMGLSLMVFVFFEIGKMIVAGIMTRRASRMLFRDDTDAGTLKSLQASSERVSLWVSTFWIWALIPTVVFGVAGAGKLLILLFRGMTSEV